MNGVLQSHTHSTFLSKPCQQRLTLPNFSQSFVIETNASGVGVGVVLLQHEHPIVFHSRKLGVRLEGSSANIKELYAITEAVAKWRQYLLGHRFTLCTDHKSLKEILQQKIHTSEQQRYVRKLLGFDFSIEYKPGKQNVVTDALSRAPEGNEDVHILTIASNPIAGFLEALRDENQLNPGLI